MSRSIPIVGYPIQVQQYWQHTQLSANNNWPNQNTTKIPTTSTQMGDEDSRIRGADDSWQGNNYSSVISGNGDTLGTLLMASGHAIPRTAAPRENGAGDMTSATRSMIWRTRANNYQFPPSMPCLRLMKSFLIMVATIILLNLSVTLVLGWATQYTLSQNSLRSDVKETIRRGNMAIKYIHAVNEDLKSRRDKQPSAVKTKIVKLNEAFGDLAEKIRLIMNEGNDEYQSEHFL